GSVYVIGASSCSFFFSSRRRHTRFSRDWSSDVCSSDLLLGFRQDVQQPGCQVTQFAHTPFSFPSVCTAALGAERGGDLHPSAPEIGRASCRERVCISVGVGALPHRTASHAGPGSSWPAS